MNELLSPFERLLDAACPPDNVRAVERGASVDALWSALEESGFLDILVPEAAGGAGLALAQAFDLMVAEGARALPVPYAHTVLVRGLLGEGGHDLPRAPIALASRIQSRGEALSCLQVPYGLVAGWVLIAHRNGCLLVPTDAARREASGVHGSLRADLHFDAVPPGALRLERKLDPWMLGAAVTAAQLAGALERVLALTTSFANDRVQFGKPIAKFQVIQHQLAVIAEHVAAARISAQIGCTSPGLVPVALRAAAAKARASEAAALAAPLCHGIHGAIGITAELDLQLYTRRLHEWRSDFGAESHWHAVIGRALLASDATALDFMRHHLIPSNQELSA